MTDITPKERAARIKLDFTIGPETEKRLREAIEHECLNAMQQERRRCFEIADRYFHKARRAHDMVAASHAAVISDAIAERVPVAQRTERAGPNGDAAGSIPAGDAKPMYARGVIVPEGTITAYFPGVKAPEPMRAIDGVVAILRTMPSDDARLDFLDDLMDRVCFNCGCIYKECEMHCACTRRD